MNRDLEWQRRYEECDTPWDKGRPAPPLVAYLKRAPIVGRVLVPGCGKGHDVRAIGGQAGATVVGLDISSAAIAAARGLSGRAGDGSRVEFLEGDFFALPPELWGSFDWVVEHTCFCAIEPRLREDYVRSAASALRPGGMFFGIFYINPDVEEGPPFRVSREVLADGGKGSLFGSAFELVEEWVPGESFEGREGRELVCVFRRR